MGKIKKGKRKNSTSNTSTAFQVSRRADPAENEYYGIITKPHGDGRFQATIVLHYNSGQEKEQMAILRGKLRRKRSVNNVEIGTIVLLEKDPINKNPTYYIVYKYNEKDISELRQEGLIPSSEDDMLCPSSFSLVDQENTTSDTDNDITLQDL